MRGRPVIWRAIRIANRFASVAESVTCHSGRPNLSARASPTTGASGDGIMVVMARADCSAAVAATAGGACPVMAPVSPRQKSAYSLPSTSKTVEPSARSANTGNPRPTSSSSSSARRRTASRPPCRRVRAISGAFARKTVPLTFRQREDALAGRAGFRSNGIGHIPRTYPFS